MSDLQREIHEWRRTLAVGSSISEPAIDELESHLRETIRELRRLGLTDVESFLVAIHRLGRPAVLQREFAKECSPIRPWCTRLHLFIAAAAFATAGAGQLVLVRAHANYPEWLPRIDEPVLFWMAFPLFAWTAYATISMTMRRLPASRLMGPAILLATLVCGYIGLMNWNYVPPSAFHPAWYVYMAVLGICSAASVAYLVRGVRARAAVA